MRVPFRAVAGLDDVIAWHDELGARSLIFDVEPLVALWDTDEQALRIGVETVVDRLSSVDGVEAVCFATNSTRHLHLDSHKGMAVSYIAGARKPLSLDHYRHLPRPGMVVGDQVATDGLLARRLGFAFAHVQYTAFPPPLGPRMMRQLGRPLRPRLFS